MSLKISHKCWEGNYFSFNQWRNRVAEAGGYEVAEVKFKKGWAIPVPLLDYGHITHHQTLGIWEKPPNDPLLVLLAHSDCEGHIFPKEAKKLAKKLTKMLPFMVNDGYITKKFIDGLLRAVKKNQKVTFYG